MAESLGAATDILNLVTQLHRRALLTLANSSGHHFQGCAAGAKTCGISGQLGRRLRELDAVKGWCCKISIQSCDAFISKLEAALHQQHGHAILGGPLVEVGSKHDAAAAETSTLAALTARVRALEVAHSSCPPAFVESDSSTVCDDAFGHPIMGAPVVSQNRHYEPEAEAEAVAPTDSCADRQACDGCIQTCGDGNCVERIDIAELQRPHALQSDLGLWAESWIHTQAEVLQLQVAHLDERLDDSAVAQACEDGDSSESVTSPPCNSIFVQTHENFIPGWEGHVCNEPDNDGAIDPFITASSFSVLLDTKLETHMAKLVDDLDSKIEIHLSSTDSVHALTQALEALERRAAAVLDNDVSSCSDVVAGTDLLRDNEGEFASGRIEQDCFQLEGALQEGRHAFGLDFDTEIVAKLVIVRLFDGCNLGNLSPSKIRAVWGGVERVMKAEGTLKPEVNYNDILHRTVDHMRTKSA